MNTRTAVCTVMLAACTTVNADTRPDSHAPITVMGDHIHQMGEVMVSYRYMHMLGLMYAPTDRLTLMGMANYQNKDMTHITFPGPMGASRLSKFKTNTSGIGDTTCKAG